MTDRPIYENESSLKNEAGTAFEVEKAWGCKLIKLPIKNQIDFLMKDKAGNSRAFVEVKNRACKRHQYPTYMISLHKWVAGMNNANYLCMEFVLVVNWDDEIGYLKCKSNLEGITVNMGGREDRGDAQDIEPVVHIPIYLFKTLVTHE